MFRARSYIFFIVVTFHLAIGENLPSKSGIMFSSSFQNSISALDIHDINEIFKFSQPLSIDAILNRECSVTMVNADQNYDTLTPTLFISQVTNTSLICDALSKINVCNINKTRTRPNYVIILFKIKLLNLYY